MKFVAIVTMVALDILAFDINPAIGCQLEVITKFDFFKGSLFHDVYE